MADGIVPSLTERRLTLFALDPSVRTPGDRVLANERAPGDHADGTSSGPPDVPAEMRLQLSAEIDEAARRRELVLALSDTTADKWLYLARHRTLSKHATDAVGSVIATKLMAASDARIDMRFECRLRKRDLAVMRKCSRKWRLCRQHAKGAETLARPMKGFGWVVTFAPPRGGMQPDGLEAHLKVLVRAVCLWAVDQGGLSAADADSATLDTLASELPFNGHCWHGGVRLSSTVACTDVQDAPWIHWYATCAIDMPRAHKWAFISLELTSGGVPSGRAPDDVVADADAGALYILGCRVALRDAKWKDGVDLETRKIADADFHALMARAIPKPYHAAVVQPCALDKRGLPAGVPEATLFATAAALVDHRHSAAQLKAAKLRAMSAERALQTRTRDATAVQSDLQLRIDALSATAERYRQRIAALEAEAVELDTPDLPAPPEPATERAVDTGALARLRDANADLSVRVDGLTAELDATRDELWRMNQRLAADVRTGVAAPQARTLLPTLSALGAWAESNLRGRRVVLTRRALGAAEKSPFEHPQLVADALAAMADWYWPLLFGADPSARQQWIDFLAASHLTCGPVGAAVTNRNTASTYGITYMGRRLQMDHHIQGNSDRNLTRQFRLYYAIDEEARALVVGHLPSHLPNTHS
ncbi:MAG TPA: hypothetical protein VFQ88_12300 [Nevskiaceae bacterium]|nr:hypothetical protein [Nevskiaceae bacterium]